MNPPARPSTAPQVVAFVLPQFHAIAENSAWWGEGFTEWRNVRRATPQFRDHDQPRVPMGRKYYDLRVLDTQSWQCELARAHGVSGFCYYHYWFNGKRLLEQPVDLLLERGIPDFPFCLAWANEPWTRAWDGGDREVLMPQTYGGAADWRVHFDRLLKAFVDPRYMRHGGKPVFLVYRSASIVDCAGMFDYWRKWAVDSGLPGLHLVQMLTGFEADTRHGLFDATVDFEPMHTMYHHYSRRDRQHERLARHRAKFVRWVGGQAPHAPNSFDYDRVWARIIERPAAPDRYPGAFVDWDNSPRREIKRAIVMRNFSVAQFEAGLTAQYKKAEAAAAPYVFINAWNEWAEGTYLEPDETRGMALLEAVGRATDTTRR